MGIVPYYEITMYCSLQFLNVGLAQCQKIVYLGVKQHAFAEIAVTTFTQFIIRLAFTKKNGCSIKNYGSWNCKCRSSHELFSFIFATKYCTGICCFWFVLC